jgi:hypothetical protein
MELKELERRIKIVEDWKDTLEEKNIDFGSIETEITEIKKALKERIKTESEFDKTVLNHISKVDADFYDNGKGLKYDLIQMLRNFNSIILKVQSIEESLTYQGRKIVNILLACLGGIITGAAALVYHFIIK